MHKKLLLYIVSLIFLASCGTTKIEKSYSAKSTAISDEVISYGSKYLGRPYRMGASGTSSFDCSGFTSHVFRKFGYKLPHSSAGQDRQVESVQRKQDLRPGDLVFFEGRSHNGRVGHVGIVSAVKSNGDFEFIHASTSRGVIFSKSTERYYASRYLRGGRVLNEGVEVAEEASKKASKQSKQVAKYQASNAYTPAVAKAPKRKKEEEPVAAPQLSDSTLIAQTLQDESNNAQQVIVRREMPESNSENTSGSSQKSDENESNTAELQFIAPARRNVPRPIVKDIPDTDGDDLSISYEVVMGDTLYDIAKRYNCTVKELKQWNPQLGKVLRAGNVVKIYRAQN